MIQPYLIPATTRIDPRGVLRVWEHLPFAVVRAFQISDVPKDETRANHAHKTCTQIIACTTGKFILITAHKSGSVSWFMKEGDSVYVPPLTWIILDKFSTYAKCMVFCSEQHSPPITEFVELERLWNDSVS